MGTNRSTRQYAEPISEILKGHSNEGAKGDTQGTEGGKIEKASHKFEL